MEISNKISYKKKLRGKELILSSFIESNTCIIIKIQLINWRDNNYDNQFNF